MMKTDVICIGQAVVDCIVRGREEMPAKKNVYRAESITLSTGGDALNESVHLAALGHSVKVVCGLGRDNAGGLILSTVQNYGINGDDITVSDDLATVVANLNVNTDGTRSSVNSRAAMLGDYLPSADVVREARIVSLASLFRAPLDRADVVRELILEAKRQGAIVCADTKLPTYREIHLKDLEDVLPLIDYIFPNETEAAYYSGREDFAEMAREIHRMGVKNVIVKAGKQGCFVCSDEGSFQIESRNVRAVDSSGAGDAFAAGFIDGLLRGLDLRGCCESGTDRAALCVQHVGCTSWV